MELVVILAFVLGMVTGVVGYSLIRTAKLKPSTVKSVLSKPKPSEYSSYTLEELHQHKKYLDTQYRNNVNYPVLRQHNLENLKLVMAEIEYREMEDGTYALIQQREHHKQELAAYDAAYEALLKGNNPGPIY